MYIFYEKKCEILKILGAAGEKNSKFGTRPPHQKKSSVPPPPPPPPPTLLNDTALSELTNALHPQFRQAPLGL